MTRPHIVIISPATAKANNGNWQTAARWARFLRERYRVTIATEWQGARCDAMIALHARRSAASLAAFAAACPALPSALALTGTDLYRDIRNDPLAQRSLQLASRLVVLQEKGVLELPEALRARCAVIHQSAPALKPAQHSPRARHYDVIMVGHLRGEKDPATFMQAAPLVRWPRTRLLHVGGALEPELALLAEQTQRAEPRYHWLGNQAHARTRQLLRQSRLLVISSRMEGGANVIIEAVTSGVPVLATDIPGNRGMLGDDYDGYFPVGDSRALASLIDRCIDRPAFHAGLQAQCAQRAKLFAPERERAAVLQLADNMLTLNRNPT